MTTLVDHNTMIKAEIVHRWNLGDIIIRHQLSSIGANLPDFVSETNGVLIDLDHAKSVDKTKSVNKGKSFSYDEVIDRTRVLNKWSHVSVAEDAVARAMELLPSSVDPNQYIKDAIRLNVLKSPFGRKFTAEDLGWRDVLPSHGANIGKLVSKTSGILIDLDYAKSSDGAKSVKVMEPQPDDVSDRTRFLIKMDRIPVAEDAVSRAMQLLSRTIYLAPYTYEAIESNVLDSRPNGNFTAEDLGWQVMDEYPDFELRITDPARRRTGTVPFISHRILTHSKEVHHGIHDMESLFWVVINICLNFRPGGGQRWPIKSTPNQKLVKELFEGADADIGFEKWHYFQENGEEDLEDLLKQTDSYFEPLHNMLKRWRNVLVLGYQFKAFEFYLVHDYILEIIDDTRKKVEVRQENIRTDSIIIETLRT